MALEAYVESAQSDEIPVISYKNFPKNITKTKNIFYRQQKFLSCIFNVLARTITPPLICS